MTFTQETKEAVPTSVFPATVLVVDDDPQALSALQRALRNEPYEAVFTNDPFEALHWVTNRGFHLVITDEFMPGMMGTELLEAVRHRSPDAAMILLTGYPNMAVSYRGFQPRVDLLIVKPWDDKDLREQARRLLQEYGWTMPAEASEVEAPAGDSPPTSN